MGGFALNLPINYFAVFEARKEEIMNDPSQLIQNFEPAVASASKTVYYKVKKNESIGKIAAKYGVSVSSIKKWNKLKNSYVYSGQKLKIVTPAPSSTVSSTYAQAFSNKVIEKLTIVIDTVAKTETLVSSEVADTLTDTSSIANNKIGLDKSCNCVYHVVQQGDTLWSITKRYQGLTIDKIKADNKSIMDKPIKVGDIIKILL